jgi:hypothetical protein
MRSTSGYDRPAVADAGSTMTSRRMKPAARGGSNLPTPQRNCPTSSRRRLCEQVFVLAQELR